MAMKPQSNVVPALALVSVFPLALLIASCGLGINIDIAKQATDEFHREFNQGSIGTAADAIYEGATDNFRMNIPRELNRRQFARLRRKMGSCPSSVAQRIAVNAGARGVYVDAIYKTTCTAGPLDERFVWKIESGKAELDQYEARSPLSLSD